MEHQTVDMPVQTLCFMDCIVEYESGRGETQAIFVPVTPNNFLKLTAPLPPFSPLFYTRS